MKDTGIVRRLDRLGRITLPIELRRSLGIADRDSIQIYSEGNQIVLKKYAACDVFTGEQADDLVEYEGLMVSKKSIKKLSKLAGLI
nr:AbrB/MazE/SpoVT family DNA-binding domain-containing protein [Eubacterium sp.]